MKTQTNRIHLTLALVLAISMISTLAFAQSTEPTPAIVSVTTEELATFTGKDGVPAYVAVDGVVYDVTNVPAWAGGEHQGQYEAGQDLSEVIHNAAPHGVSVLEDLPIVAYLLVADEENDVVIPTETFTVTELAAFTGKDGGAAYIAVDGIVYDVTASAQWMDGVHQGQYDAGLDFSQLIREVSPHGISVLEGLPVVGRLVFDQFDTSPTGA